MLIEKGVNTEKILKKDRFKISWLKLGIIIVGLGLGLALVGILLQLQLIKGGDPFVLAILVLSVGLSFIIANSVERDN